MRAKIRVRRYDGSEQEAEGVFAGWADQIAFERRFGLNASVLGKLGRSFDEEGALRDDADPAAIRSEWMAFLAYRVVARGPAAGTSFDEWMETVADLDLAVEDGVEMEDAAPVPTSATVTQLPSS